MSFRSNFEAEVAELQMVADASDSDETELEDGELADQQEGMYMLPSTDEDEEAEESEDVDLLAPDDPFEFLGDDPEVVPAASDDEAAAMPEILDFFFLQDAMDYPMSDGEVTPEPEPVEEEVKPELAGLPVQRPRCPISYKYLTVDNAVGTEYGHAFDEKSIQRWIDKKGLCPLTRQFLSRHTLFKPIALQESMQYSSALEAEVKKLSDEKAVQAEQASQEMQAMRVENAALRAERDGLKKFKRKFSEVSRLVMPNDEPPARNTRQRVAR